MANVRARSSSSDRVRLVAHTGWGLSFSLAVVATAVCVLEVGAVSVIPEIATISTGYLWRRSGLYFESGDLVAISGLRTRRFAPAKVRLLLRPAPWFLLYVYPMAGSEAVYLENVGEKPFRVWGAVSVGDSDRFVARIWKRLDDAGSAVACYVIEDADESEEEVLRLRKLGIPVEVGGRVIPS